jgi:prepilin peptidase CpaA
MNQVFVVAVIVLTAVVVAVLLRIAAIDFKTQKITNRDVLLVALAGSGNLVVQGLQTGLWMSGLGLSAIAAALFFVLLFPFWLMGKVGAGDVKLMAAAPLVAGGQNLLVFAILLLVFAIFTAFAVKNPILLPAPMFRQYLQHFERKGVVPFGVPIAAALLGVTAAKAFQFLGA